jgi:hypothetical protein
MFLLFFFTLPCEVQWLNPMSTDPLTLWFHVHASCWQTHGKKIVDNKLIMVTM